MKIIAFLKTMEEDHSLPHYLYQDGIIFNLRNKLNFE